MSLLATLKPTTSTWNDGSDATYSTHSVFLSSPPPATGTTDPGDTGAMDDGPGSGAILHLVFRARVKALNPSDAGDAAAQSNPRIFYVADHPATNSAEKSCGNAPENGGFGWVQTAAVALAPDGAAWDWARIASLRSTRMRADWYLDIDPGSGTYELQMSEIEVLVYGPEAVALTPAPASLAVVGYAPTVAVSVLVDPHSPYWNHEMRWRTGYDLARP